MLILCMSVKTWAIFVGKPQGPNFSDTLHMHMSWILKMKCTL